MAFKLIYLKKKDQKETSKLEIPVAAKRIDKQKREHYTF